MAVQCIVYVREEGITEGAGGSCNITVTDTNGKTFSLLPSYQTINNKTYAEFDTTNASNPITITTSDAFESTAVDMQLVGDSYIAYVELEKKNLYAWYGSIFMAENQNWYTITKTPTTSDYLYRENGEMVSAWSGYENLTSDTLTAVDLSATPPTISVQYSTSG